MSRHLPIINSWTGSGFKENPEQSVSSLLINPVRNQQQNNAHVSTPNSQPSTPNSLSARRNP
jgi:hypothetical protein